MSTRSKKLSQPTANINSILPKRIENSWIMLINEALFENVNFSIITLPHPAHGQSTKFCLDDMHNKIYEIVTFDEPYRSWFIGDYVKSDGSISMATPINPLFLVLPRLREQCLNRAVPLEDLLSEKGFDKIINYVTNINTIADLKGPKEIKAYKYNEKKTLKWLEDRVRKLAKVLRQKKIHVMPGAISATFVTSNLNSDSIDDEFYLKYAHGMVSEYLQNDLAEKLEELFNFKPEIIESVGKKRKSEGDLNILSKKFKSQSSTDDLNTIESDVINPTQMKKKPMTAKEKARQKAASGTKVISAFFTKK